MYFEHHVHVHTGIAIYYSYRKELSVKIQNKSGFFVQKYFNHIRRIVSAVSCL